MARDRSPIVKQSRREKFALANKAHKVMARKTTTPGQHSDRPGNKGSLYLTQMREKQKVRRLYGLMEKQFANLMVTADRQEGMSGENLIKLLEARLDNVIFRAGYANSRRAARQLVSHGHFLLNGRRVDIPSLRVKTSDVITVRPKSQKSVYFQNLDNLNTEKRPISWLNSDLKKMQVTITGEPVRAEIEDGINEQLIVEYYSR
ncbi:30S ribosomal protein S4 [Candidatus Saccharibacteria bacterium]|nr:30S ribosomal protein S4 [Candidatus Saccharibacteria bacterium]